MRYTYETGVVYIELALVIPVLLLIGFACLEISNALRTKQALVMLSRDMASSSLRRCTEIDSNSEIRTCLQSLHDIFENRSRNLLELKDQDLNNGLKFILSVYKYQNTCTSLVGCQQYGAAYPANRTVTLAGTTKVSEFNSNDFFTTSGKYHELLLNSRALVTVEIYLAYQPLILSTFGKVLGSSGNTRRIFYEVAFF